MDELGAELAAERAAHADAQAALEALVRQQPPAAPRDVFCQQAAQCRQQAGARAEQLPSPEAERSQQQHQRWQAQRQSSGGDTRLAEQAAQLRQSLQRAQDSNAALRTDLHQTQHANALLRASLEAEAAAAAATHAADTAESRALAERLRRSEGARIEAVQVVNCICLLASLRPRGGSGPVPYRSSHRCESWIVF